MSHDHDSKIDFQQFYKILTDCSNLDIEKSHAKQLFDKLDDDQSGKITEVEVNELVRMLSRIEYPIQSEVFLRIFNMIDIDHSKWIHVTELIEFME